VAGIGAMASHTYAEAGVYNVTVTASNSVSKESAQMLIVIEGSDSGQNVQQIMLPLIQR
jgi:PKD repeat protein